MAWRDGKRPVECRRVAAIESAELRRPSREEGNSRPDVRGRTGFKANGAWCGNGPLDSRSEVTHQQGALDRCRHSKDSTKDFSNCKLSWTGQVASATG